MVNHIKKIKKTHVYFYYQYTRVFCQILYFLSISCITLLSLILTDLVYIIKFLPLYLTYLKLSMPIHLNRFLVVPMVNLFIFLYENLISLNYDFSASSLQRTTGVSSAQRSLKTVHLKSMRGLS